MRPPHFLLSILICAMAASAPLHAQEPSLPLSIHERLWERPGPAQDEPGAPRLLIVYPEKNSEPLGGSATRYAGRVSPEDARVTLNGEELKVWPGGVFTGVKSLGAAQEATWRFEAAKGGQSTVVARQLSRRPPVPPVPDWPPTFDRTPADPVGDYFLHSGDRLGLRLYASRGMRAEFRVGPDGAWMPMSAGEADRRHGVYTATWIADAPTSVPAPRRVSFRVSGERNGDRETKSIDAALRVAALPAGASYPARVTGNLATFLKDNASWERWGNWPRGTPFPVLELHDDRLRTSFGHGESGWIETDKAKVDWTPAAYAAPRLGRAEIMQTSHSLIVRWPAVPDPIPVVFNEIENENGWRLEIDLPGAASAASLDRTLPEGGRFHGVHIRDAAGGAAPRVTIELAEPLWGFNVAGDAAHGLSLEARVRPRLPGASAARPLAGLRVMLDAGHGGRDLGSVGPSGLCESDLNLVEAAWLERDLRAMGAEVRQVRRDDEFIDLDARVDMALAWDPDLFISLHHNSVGFSTDPLSDHGSKVFYHYADGVPIARTLAESITPVLTADGQVGVLPQVFRVNRNVSLCPSVLIESGFVCNPVDEIKLRRTETIKSMAAAIAAGVKNLFP